MTPKDIEELEKQPPLNLIGTIQIVGDLEAASKKAADKFTRSIKETVEQA